MDRVADCNAKGIGFESRVRHGCKIASPFIGGNGDRLLGAVVVGVKADCLTRDLGLYVGCPPWGSF